MSHRKLGSKEIRAAYAFLRQAEEDGRIFTAQELSAGSGWSTKTTKANLTKKLAQLIRKVDGGFQCVGARHLTEEAFCRVCSQNSWLANDPHRPLLAPTVEGLVQKARESALGAVQHYNNPTALFRSGNYVVLMVIAYTALLHAVLERDGVDYTVYGKDGAPMLRSGKSMLWDVTRCIRYYAQNYAAKYEPKYLPAVERNLEMLVPIRDAIEHRFMPHLDADICGHCQAMLMNFERILIEEFTAYYSLNASLCMALQFSSRRSPETVGALRRFHSAEYQDLKDYITSFEASLPDDILGDPAFAFRVWLIQKSANHARSSDLSMEVVRLDGSDPSQVARLEKAILAVKTVTEERIVDPSETCTLWEKEVLHAVIERIGPKVVWAGGTNPLTATMLRWVIQAHRLGDDPRLCFRPKKAGSRPMYSLALVEWVVAEYGKDAGLFDNARQVMLNQV